MPLFLGGYRAGGRTAAASLPAEFRPFSRGETRNFHNISSSPDIIPCLKTVNEIVCTTLGFM
jgi:hypothetical protein